MLSPQRLKVLYVFAMGTAANHVSLLRRNCQSALKEATHVQLQEVRKVNEEQKIDLTLSYHSFTPLSDVDCCSLKLSDFIEIAIGDAARPNASA